MSIHGAKVVCPDSLAELVSILGWNSWFASRGGGTGRGGNRLRAAGIQVVIDATVKSSEPFLSMAGRNNDNPPPDANAGESDAGCKRRGVSLQNHRDG